MAMQGTVAQQAAPEAVAAVRRALIEAVATFEAGDADRALAAARRALQASAELVVEGSDVRFLARVQAALDRGALAALETEARERIDRGGSLDALGAPLLAQVRLARGDLVGARRALPGRGRTHGLAAEVATARLRIAGGDAAGGASELLRLADAHPSAPVAWEAEAAVALMRAGDSERAERTARAALARAELTGRERPAALRALGVATQDPSLLASAAAEGDGLVRAAALLDLGSLLRRCGERRQARLRLTRSQELATACGAAGIAEAARIEIAAAGGRPRRGPGYDRDALTPSELRVARLAAQGRSYRGIAAELFISTRTVESHLRSTYRKLGISGRDGLAAALAA